MSNVGTSLAQFFSRSNVIVVIIFAALSGNILHVVRKRQRHRKLLEGKKYQKISARSDLGQCFGADIGGTLSKLVYFEHQYDTKFLRRPRASSYMIASEEMTEYLTNDTIKYRDASLSINSDILGGGFRTSFNPLSLTSLPISHKCPSIELSCLIVPQIQTLHFLRYETRRMEHLLELVSLSSIPQRIISLACTGGGAHKYEDKFMEEAGIHFDKCDELDCLLKGVHFLLKYAPNELYTFTDVDIRTLECQRITCSLPENILVSDLVNIGSGVSILKVTGSHTFQRVSGTSLGGGTYWGLCRLLTKCKTFDEVLELAETGNNAVVDMMIEDIYGRGYDRFNLKANTIASSFGKLAATAESRNNASDGDIARALLYMITFHVTQLAYLNAVQHNTKRIFFVGNFMRHNNVSNKTAAFAINYWSDGAFQAQFFKHEGYFGALGAFLYNLEKKDRIRGGLSV